MGINHETENKFYKDYMAGHDYLAINHGNNMVLTSRDNVIFYIQKNIPRARTKYPDFGILSLFLKTNVALLPAKYFLFCPNLIASVKIFLGTMKDQALIRPLNNVTTSIVELR